MAANLARPLELDLFCRKLDADYSALIGETGVNDNAKRSNFLSKAVAAFVLGEAADASAADAVGADHTIWLVQSKYIESGTVKAGLMDALAQQNQG